MKLSFVGGKFMVRELGSRPLANLFPYHPPPPPLASLAAPHRPGALPFEYQYPAAV